MIQLTNSTKSVSATCKAHGQYVSFAQGLPYNGGSLSSWSGCPSCVREHSLALRRQGAPALKIIHRPEYRTVLTGTDGSMRETYPDLDRALQDRIISQANYDQAAALRAC